MFLEFGHSSIIDANNPIGSDEWIYCCWTQKSVYLFLFLSPSSPLANAQNNTDTTTRHCALAIFSGKCCRLLVFFFRRLNWLWKSPSIWNRISHFPIDSECIWNKIRLMQLGVLCNISSNLRLLHSATHWNIGARQVQMCYFCTVQARSLPIIALMQRQRAYIIYLQILKEACTEHVVCNFWFAVCN